MAHNTIKKGYNDLVRRLNLFPQGAPSSETLYKILKILFSDEEAELVSLLPIKPFTPEQAAKNWKMDIKDALNILDELAGRAILMDMESSRSNKKYYVLPPPMAGFIEFSMMRTRNDIDQRSLAELLHQYINVEEEFITDLMAYGDTQLGRTFIYEPALSAKNSLFVLDYERASKVIEGSSHIAVGMCYCRHKMAHLGKSCKAPLDICMTFNNIAASLIRSGFARPKTKIECMKLLETAYINNLVQFGENVQNDVSFICNCCGCCCEAMIASRKFAVLNPVHTTNFLPMISPSCTGCGKCTEVCPVEAAILVSANNPENTRQKKAKINENICLGCGICTRVCPLDCISLKNRDKRVITPVNSAHKAVMMAIERGKLQNLIFDNQAFFSHRAMAAIFGVILKLPPIKQILACEQIKSRYLGRLLFMHNQQK